MSRAGQNIVLAAILALLSYVPFEVVAKLSLIVCVFLFVVDPFSPVSRLLSLVATIVVALLSRSYRHWKAYNDENGVEVVNSQTKQPQ